MTRPSMRTRSPLAFGLATMLVKLFSKISNPACVGARPMWTYVPAVCDADSLRYCSSFTMSFSLHRRARLQPVLKPGCACAAEPNVEAVGHAVERDRGVLVERRP